MRRDNKWSARRITLELVGLGVRISERTVSRWLARVGINHRRFLDPDGSANRRPSKRIVARYSGHMVHLDVKKVGRIPDGGGWRVHGRGSEQARAAQRAKNRGAKGGCVYLHWASRHQRIKPYTPRHNGKVERYQRILAEELLYARPWTSEAERARAIAVWNVRYNHRPHTAAVTVLEPHASTRASPTSWPATTRACLLGGLVS